MIIRAVHNRNNPYFQLRRDVAQDSQLPARALGILVYLMSKPDDWEPTVDDICNRFPDVGRQQAYRIINETLIPLGYARRVCERVDGKIVRWITEIYETPVVQNQHVVPDDDIQQLAQPDDEKPHVEIQHVENQMSKISTIQINRVQNTEKQITEKKQTSSEAPQAGLRPQEFYELFAELYQKLGRYELPYRHKQADFMKRAALYADYKRMNLALTVDRVTRAARNYFATPQGKHTLADFCVRFNEFYEHALDRYGKPVEPVTNGGSNGRNQISHRETHNERAFRESFELIEQAIAPPSGFDSPDPEDSAAPWTPCLVSGL
jgi:hypothetical protein